MIVLSAFIVLAGIYLSCYVAYWGILLLAHFSYLARPGVNGAQATRFAVLIPAHNEELLLSRLLASIEAQDYPAGKFDAIVIADNCTDGTAGIARERGARVLERFHETDRGKGYALKWALETMDLHAYDAVLVVDADCFISSNALKSLDGSMQEKQVIQCYSGVGNPDESWFTRLLDVSRTLNNNIYSPGKQQLGLSSQLIGTGMCFSTGILEKFGWDSFTIGEDCEYYAKLVQHEETIGFDWNAKVYHQESVSLKQATSQRMRWSSGRFAIAVKYGFPLLVSGLLQRNAVKFDAGLSFILPNPSLGMNLTLVFLLLSFVASGGHFNGLQAWFVALTLAQLGLFLAGVAYTKNRVRKFLAIFVAPAFLAWKMGIDALTVLGVGRKKWIRTERKL